MAVNNNVDNYNVCMLRYVRFFSKKKLRRLSNVLVSFSIKKIPIRDLIILLMALLDKGKKNPCKKFKTSKISQPTNYSHAYEKKKFLKKSIIIIYNLFSSTQNVQNTHKIFECMRLFFFRTIARSKDYHCQCHAIIM